MFNKKRIEELEKQINKLATYKHSPYHTEDLHGVITSIKRELEDISKKMFTCKKTHQFSYNSYKVLRFDDLQDQIKSLQETHNTALSELRRENKKLKELLNEVIDYVYKGK